MCIILIVLISFQIHPWIGNGDFFFSSFPKIIILAWALGLNQSATRSLGWREAMNHVTSESLHRCSHQILYAAQDQETCLSAELPTPISHLYKFTSTWVWDWPVKAWLILLLLASALCWQCLGVRPLEDASLSNDQRTIIIRQTLQNTQNAGKDMFLVVWRLVITRFKISCLAESLHVSYTGIKAVV